MKILLATPEKQLFQGEASSVILPCVKGEAEILPGHTYLVSGLVPGIITIRRPDGDEHFQVTSGLVEVSDDQVVVLASS